MSIKTDVELFFFFFFCLTSQVSQRPASASLSGKKTHYVDTSPNASLTNCDLLSCLSQTFPKWKKKLIRVFFSTMDNAVLNSTGNVCKLDHSVALSTYNLILSMYFLTEGLNNNFIYYGLSVWNSASCQESLSPREQSMCYCRLGSNI